MTRWITEELHAGYRSSYRADRVLFEEKTDLQHLVIFENPHFGRMMALDGVIQVTEGDEFVYHEMMAHVPILAHGRAKRVLIIGGGDGGVLREVLRHSSVEKAVLVEIDRGVIDLCTAHMPMIANGAFDDPRAEVVITDGAAYVHDTDETFDVVIVDSTDPIGPGAVLFEKRFYEGCAKRLTPGGILVTQNGVPMLQAAELKSSLVHFRDIFALGTCYLIDVSTYTGGRMALGFASDNAGAASVALPELAARFEASGIGATKYYTPAVHAAAFAIPPWLSEKTGA